MSNNPVRIYLFEFPGDPNNQIILDKLNAIPNVLIHEIPCPALDPPMFVMPYMRLASQPSRTYFGIEDIKDFIKHRHTRLPALANG